MTGTALADQSWLELFEKFVSYLRIPSKEGAFGVVAAEAELPNVREACWYCGRTGLHLDVGRVCR